MNDMYRVQFKSENITLDERVKTFFQHYILGNVNQNATVVVDRNCVIRNINSSLLRVYSPLINSILSDVTMNNVGDIEMIITDTDSDSVISLMEVLTNGQTSLRSGDCPMADVMSLASCLQINIKSLEKLVEGNVGDVTVNNNVTATVDKSSERKDSCLKLADISRNFFKQNVANIVDDNVVTVDENPQEILNDEGDSSSCEFVCEIKKNSLISSHEEYQCILCQRYFREINNLWQHCQNEHSPVAFASNKGNF